MLGWHHVGWGFLSFVLGAISGLSEIISRYRDEPLRATLNRYGVTYLLLNGVLAVAAYAVLVKYRDPTPQDADPLVMALTAGLGSMALIRSKLFIFRGEDGKDYPIGPAIVIETFLAMLDRKIDRLRAAERQHRVFESMQNLSDYDAAANYLEASLLSFQNLSEKEKRDTADVIQAYRSLARWPAELRTMAIGFAFLTIAGEENFDAVIANLRKFLQSQRATGGTAGVSGAAANPGGGLGPAAGGNPSPGP